MCRKCSVVSRVQWNFEEIAVNEPTWWGSTIILSKERGRCKEHLGTAGLLGSTEPPARDAFSFSLLCFPRDSPTLLPDRLLTLCCSNNYGM